MKISDTQKLFFRLYVQAWNENRLETIEDQEEVIRSISRRYFTTTKHVIDSIKAGMRFELAEPKLVPTEYL